MPRRTTLDIYADILRYIKEEGEPKKRSHIVGTTHINPNRGPRYLKEMMEGNLVEETESGKIKIGNKGEAFLENIEEIREYVPLENS